MTKIEVTPDRIARVKRDWEAIGEEQLEVEYYAGGTFYGYGSELACLRLYYAYRGAKCRIFYSMPIEKWVFALEVNF